MKKQYQLREDEALHEWIDRLMERLTDTHRPASLFLYPYTNKTEKSK